MSYKQYWEKFIFIGLSIIAYFAYIRAESIAKYNIYTETGLDPMFYGTVLAYFKGIYFIPAVMLILASLLSILIVIITLLTFVPIVLDMLGLDKEMRKKMHKLVGYVILYVLGMSLLTYEFFKNNDKLYESFFGKNYIARSIIDYSYLPDKSCGNIVDGTYIKFIDKNKVSVSNMNNYKLQNEGDDLNITFELKECKK